MFRIKIALHRVTDITPELLEKMGIRGLLLDIDNTLTTHNNPTPAPGIPEWIQKMKSAGIRLMLVSNNDPPRVQPFADQLALDFVPKSKKPRPTGFREAGQRLQLPKSQLAIVGDQIFTDVLGANLFGVPCIFVEPIELETTRFFRCKRRLEKPFLPKKFYETK